MTQFARAFSVVGVVAIFGALGGFVLGMTYPAAHEITMPGLAGRSYPMGFLGDMLSRLVGVPFSSLGRSKLSLSPASSLVPFTTVEGSVTNLRASLRTKLPAR